MANSIIGTPLVGRSTVALQHVFTHYIGTSLKGHYELSTQYKNLSIKDKLYQQNSCANIMLPLLKDTMS